jgi:uncharacterized membrane protein
MTQLLIGLVLFFAGHSVSIVNVAWRDAMAARLGEWTWKGLYSLLALAGLALIIMGYADARFDAAPLYQSPNWLRNLALVLLLPVFPLLVSTYFPGRISRAAKHPTLLATKLWATAHLLVNGTLADLLLFGSFLAWAVADRISMKRRVQRPLPGAPDSAWNDLIAVVVGLGVYAGLLMGLHYWLFGVSAAPL